MISRRDALDLDVHLQRGDAVAGAGDLEIHVAEVILVAEDVGEHLEARCLPSTRPIATPATGALIGTPASISDRLVPHTLAMELEPLDSRISETTRMTYGKRRHVRHHGLDAAAREVAVADLAALRRAHHAGLAHRERREVVVQHERLAALALERVDDLRIARRCRAS